MQNNRFSSIDQFRGLAILLMVLANLTTGIKIIPAWLKHAPDIGLTANDLIAPLFIFAIGLTYSLSFSHREERDGKLSTYFHFITRFLAIIGLGAIMSALETAYGANPSGVDWGVLQAIGIAGLVTLLVIRIPFPYRWMIGVTLLGIYQVLLDRFFLPLVQRSPHGGLFGSVAWSAMLICATSLADIFHDRGRWRKSYPWISSLVLVVGVALALISPISKHRVSAAYGLVSLGVSALVFILFHWLSERFHFNSHFLIAWGKNPLALYVLHYFFIGFIFLPGIPFLYSEAPIWLVLLEIAGLVVVLTVIAYWLERKKIIISF